MRRLLFALVSLIAATTASASWTLESKTDSMTDETNKSAVAQNSEGNMLMVYRRPDGSVWANFSLSSGTLDQLSPERPPVFRIDKNQPHDVAEDKQTQEMDVGVEAYAWEPKWVNFLIW